MKKKFLSKKDFKVWSSFVNNLKNIEDKDKQIFRSDSRFQKVKKIDLHGLSLDAANQKVVKFVNDAFDSGFSKLIVVTGKGLRSKHKENPYVSESMGILKNSIPEFIVNSEVKSKIYKISPALKKDGGTGAFYIFLKKKL